MRIGAGTSHCHDAEKEAASKLVALLDVVAVPVFVAVAAAVVVIEVVVAMEGI